MKLLYTIFSAMRSLGRVSVLAMLIAIPVGQSALAAPILNPNPNTCAKGTTQLDCDAIINDWTDWVPGGAVCGASNTALIGADNIEKAYNFLIDHGLTAPQAAGVVGNMMVEDPGLVPTTVQGGGQSPVPPDHGGYGIVQWTPGTKLTGIMSAAHLTGGPDQLVTQLNALWAQLTGTALGFSETAAYDDLRKQTTPEGAAVSFLAKYERAKDHSPTGPNAQVRSKNANEVLARYSGGATGTTTVQQCASTTTCTTGSASVPAGLSAVRQKVVCIAEQELAKWTPPGPIPRLKYLTYSDGAEEEWCADFASWVYNQAGYPFTGGVSGGWRLPAVLSIEAIGVAGQKFHWHPEAGYTPKPGDLVIHRKGDSHVNIVVSVSGNVVNMVGGDQGSGPYGGPNSASVVSKATSHGGFLGGDISGYVSPD